jgi:P-type Mg2+ transporter
MNWFKHILNNNRNNKEANDDLKKKLFDKLSVFAKEETSFALNELKSKEEGLNIDEATKRIKVYGVNSIADDNKTNHFLKFFNIVKSPINLLLISLAIVSLLVGDLKAFIVIIVMVSLSIILNFYQETKAGIAAEKLKSIIHTKTTVIRNGKRVEIDIKGVVPGDIVYLYSGTIIPGDIRLLSSKDLSINQAMLTGESLPVEKHVKEEDLTKDNIIDYCNLCFLGTSVETRIPISV